LVHSRCRHSRRSRQLGEVEGHVNAHPVRRELQGDAPEHDALGEAQQDAGRLRVRPQRHAAGAHGALSQQPELHGAAVGHGVRVHVALEGAVHTERHRRGVERDGGAEGADRARVEEHLSMQPQARAHHLARAPALKCVSGRSRCYVVVLRVVLCGGRKHVFVASRGCSLEIHQELHALCYFRR